MDDCWNTQVSGFRSQVSRLPATWADIAKAKRLLGWSPQVTPAEGFTRAVEWHVANRAWLKNLKT